MFRYSMWATVAALALWVGAVGTANAQHRGGGGGGGHGGGGFHSGGGGFHGGGGGFRDGGFRGGRGGYYGGFGLGLGYGGYYGGYGLGYGYPSYGWGGYGYSNPYYGGYGDTYVYPSTVYSGDYAPNVVTVVPGQSTTQSNYYTPATDNRARIHVRLPADAALWVDGDATQQTGADRDFVTPPLDTGRTFTYTFKARWMNGAEPVERTMKVDVRANEPSQVDFMR